MESGHCRALYVFMKYHFIFCRKFNIVTLMKILGIYVAGSFSFSRVSNNLEKTVFKSLLAILKHSSMSLRCERFHNCYWSRLIYGLLSVRRIIKLVLVNPPYHLILSQPNPNLNPNTTKKLGETRYSLKTTPPTTNSHYMEEQE